MESEYEVVKFCSITSSSWVVDALQTNELQAAMTNNFLNH